MSAQPAASGAQGLELELVILEFSRRGELGAARRGRWKGLNEARATGAHRRLRVNKYMSDRAIKQGLSRSPTRKQGPSEFDFQGARRTSKGYCKAFPCLRVGLLKPVFLLRLRLGRSGLRGSASLRRRAAGRACQADACPGRTWARGEEGVPLMILSGITVQDTIKVQCDNSVDSFRKSSGAAIVWGACNRLQPVPARRTIRLPLDAVGIAEANHLILGPGGLCDRAG